MQTHFELNIFLSFRKMYHMYTILYRYLVKKNLGILIS